MRRKILASILAMSIIVGSISIAHAESYIITTTWSTTAYVTWETLNAIAGNVAIEISAGRTSANPNACIEIRNSGTTYYIAVVNENSNTLVGYIGSYGSNAVYACSGRGYLYNAVDDIRTYCGNIQSLLTGMANTISNLYSTDPTNPKVLNNIEDLLINKHYTSYSVDDSDNPYPLYEVSSNTAYQIISHLNNTLVDRNIYYISSGGSASKYQFVSAQEYNGYIRCRIRSTGATPSYFNVYLCTPERNIYHFSNSNSSGSFDDTEILNAIKSNLYACGSSAGTFNVSNYVIDSLINYINSNMLGKAITYVASNGNTNTYYVRGAYRQNNKVRVTLENANGNSYSTTCYLCNKYRYNYVADSTNNPVENSIITTIPEKLQNLYDWLDSADLATNSTIINIVNQYSQDVENSIPNFNNVNGIFKAAFGATDDSHTAADWVSAIEYFANLWQDPEEGE